MAVLVNDSHVRIGGSSNVNVGGNVALSAKASTETSAKAANGGISGNSGGFIAVQVSNQDCDAAITGSSNVAAVT